MTPKPATFPPSHLPDTRAGKVGRSPEGGNLILREAILAIAKVGRIHLAGEHIRVSLPEAHLRRQIAAELELIQAHREEAIALLRSGENHLPTADAGNSGGGKVLSQENQILKATFPLCDGYGGGEVGRWEGPTGNQPLPTPSEAELDAIDAAMTVMNAAGARILPGPVLAIPAGMLTGEVRWAVRALGMVDLALVTLPEVES